MEVTKDLVTTITLNNKEVALLRNIMGFQMSHMVGKLKDVHDKVYIKRSEMFIMNLNKKLSSVS